MSLRRGGGAGDSVGGGGALSKEQELQPEVGWKILERPSADPNPLTIHWAFMPPSFFLTFFHSSFILSRNLS